jgi:hypothetical protein
MVRAFLIPILSFLVLQTQAQTSVAELNQRSDAFFQKYVSDGLVDYHGIQRTEFDALLALYASDSAKALDGDTLKAFLINAYNLAVIDGVLKNGIPASVQDVNRFFDNKVHTVAGRKLSLNELEKEWLFKEFGDPRLHFVLVCGAVGCPPLISEAYHGYELSAQIDRQCILALNDEQFLRYDAEEETLYWSELFQWYANHFGYNKFERILWVRTFNVTKIPTDTKTRTIAYDWRLNAQPTHPAISGGYDSLREPRNNEIRYVVSSTIPKGSTETKIFNNLYTQRIGEGMDAQRSNFFTTFVTSLYGVSNTFNAGLELRYRRVSNEMGSSSPFEIFNDVTRNGSRHELATIGPKVRWAPVPKWGNFSIQSGLWFPLRNDLEGPDQPYVDWNGPTWWTQFFNDFTIGNRFSLFTEIDFLWEDMGRGGDDLNRMSTPGTVIFSYFPEPKTTLYVLNGFSPTWAPDLDYFYQGGVGAKYQFTRKFELEFLYTYFTNSFLQEQNGRASTINFGLRINT